MQKRDQEFGESEALVCFVHNSVFIVCENVHLGYLPSHRIISLKVTTKETSGILWGNLLFLKKSEIYCWT